MWIPSMSLEVECSLECELLTSPLLQIRMPLLVQRSLSLTQTVVQQVQHQLMLNGVASDIKFVTATVDMRGKDVPSLAGYTALTVAEVEYDYTLQLTTLLTSDMRMLVCL